MKKVICVDDEQEFIKTGRDYLVRGESADRYLITDDDGYDGWFLKSIFKDAPIIPDSEPTYQYGQEVEVSLDEDNWSKRIFIAEKFHKDQPNYQWRYIVEDNKASIMTYQYIRPIRSIREQIVEVLKNFNIDTTKDEDYRNQLADRIIEITEKSK